LLAHGDLHRDQKIAIEVSKPKLPMGHLGDTRVRRIDQADVQVACRSKVTFVGKIWPLWQEQWEGRFPR
jgi:hypothetical protein